MVINEERKDPEQISPPKKSDIRLGIKTQIIYGNPSEKQISLNLRFYELCKLSIFMKLFPD